MSAAQPSQAVPAGAASAPVPTPQPPRRDICPLCGGPLQGEQEWCLRCGAAARTRLAAAPNWRGPAIALVLIVAISLGVLAASLVKLAGDSSSPAQQSTPAAATPVAPTTTAAGSIVAPTASTAAPAPAGSVATTSPSTPTTAAPALSPQSRERIETLQRNVERAKSERLGKAGK